MRLRCCALSPASSPMHRCTATYPRANVLSLRDLVSPHLVRACKHLAQRRPTEARSSIGLLRNPSPIYRAPHFQPLPLKHIKVTPQPVFIRVSVRCTLVFNDHISREQRPDSQPNSLATFRGNGACCVRDTQPRRRDQDSACASLRERGGRQQ